MSEDCFTHEAEENKRVGTCLEAARARKTNELAIEGDLLQEVTRKALSLTRFAKFVVCSIM